jgi:pyruvate/2-oxoglutarate dehydrogenase complex dihydrolipoamide dehydrogenase (E3) component
MPWGIATGEELSLTLHITNDYEIVAANLLDGEQRRVSDRILAYALYIDPPLGRAGMTETEALKSGRKVLIGKRPMTRVARAVEKGETNGFMKILVDAETNEILGASLLGVECDEVHSFNPGCDVRQSALYGDPTRDAHPPYCHRINTDHARRAQALRGDGSRLETRN